MVTTVWYTTNIMFYKLSQHLCRRCTCKCQATCHVAAQYGNLLSGYLTPAGIISHHSNNWCLRKKEEINQRKVTHLQQKRKVSVASTKCDTVLIIRCTAHHLHQNGGCVPARHVWNVAHPLHIHHQQHSWCVNDLTSHFTLCLVNVSNSATLYPKEPSPYTIHTWRAHKAAINSWSTTPINPSIKCSIDTTPQNQVGTVLPPEQILLQPPEFQRLLKAQETVKLCALLEPLNVEKTQQLDMKRDRLVFSLSPHTLFLKKCHSGPREPTWVKPTHRPSWSHYVSSTSNKVPPISNDDAVLRHQLVHTLQDFQGIQVVLRLLISFSPGTKKESGLTLHADRTPSVLVSMEALQVINKSCNIRSWSISGCVWNWLKNQSRSVKASGPGAFHSPTPAPQWKPGLSSVSSVSGTVTLVFTAARWLAC